HRTSAPLQVGVHYGADRVAVGIGFEVQDLAGEHDGGEQVVQALARPRRDVHALELATVVPGDDALGGELLMDAVDVGVLPIDLVDGHHDGDAGRAGVVYGFDGLRHHAVVRRHHQHGHVGHRGTARSH